MRPHRLMPTNVCILALCYYIHILSVHFIFVCLYVVHITLKTFVCLYVVHITLKTYYMLPFFAQILDFPEATIQLSLDRLPPALSKSWVHRVLLQARSQGPTLALQISWTAMAIAVAAFCEGIQKHHPYFLEQVGQAKVYLGLGTQDHRSLLYTADLIKFHTNELMCQPLMSTSERWRIASLLKNALSSCCCSGASDETRARLLAKENTNVTLSAALSLSSGLLINPLRMTLPDTYGCPAALASLTTMLLGTRTAVRLLNGSVDSPYPRQSETIAMTRMIDFFSEKASTTLPITNQRDAELFYRGPSSLSCIGRLATRQKRARTPSSSSSSSEASPPTARKVATPPKSDTVKTADPVPLLSLNPTPIGVSGTSKVSSWKGTKIGAACPRGTKCRGRWYSKRLKRLENCLYGCTPS